MNDEIASLDDQQTDQHPNRKFRFLLPIRMPVAVKLAISISTVVTAGMGLLGAFIIHNQTQVLNDQIRTFGRLIVHQMSESAKEPILANDTLLLDVLAANLASSNDIIGTVIYSSERQILAQSGASPFEPGAPYNQQQEVYLDGTLRSLNWQWQSSHWGHLDAVSFISPVVFQNVVAGYTMISISRLDMTITINQAVRSIVVTTLVFIALGAIISYFLGRRLSKPLDSFMDASKAIGDGRFDFRMDEGRNDEIGYLMGAFNSMAQGLLEKEQVEEAFSRYVSPGVAKEILGNLDQVQIGGKPIEGSVIFVDIVGFTAKAETMSPEEVAELLNEFYVHVSHAVSIYHGTVDKYMGDGAMLVFGTPKEDLDHAFHAIACAVYLQQLVRMVNKKRISKGQFPVFYRIGLNSGEMLAGNMGSSDHMQFTVVGDSVNLASRLCSASGSDQIIVSKEMLAQPGVQSRVISKKHQDIRVRGKTMVVSTYVVEGVREPYQSIMAQEISAFVGD